MVRSALLRPPGMIASTSCTSHFPLSYGKEPARRYPVVYFTDAYWVYQKARAIYWGLEYDKTIPEVILVGIGYVGENLDYNELRTTDLSPPVQTRNMFAPGLIVGHADEFLRRSRPRPFRSSSGSIAQIHDNACSWAGLVVDLRYTHFTPGTNCSRAM